MSEYIDLTPTCNCGYAHNLEVATTCKQCGGPYPPANTKAGRARAVAKNGGPPAPIPKRNNTGARRRHVFVATGAEHGLRVDQPFTMGRSKDCTLTVPSQRVSRKHAEVFWRSGFPVIKNMSSANPTKVNGRPIDEHELRDGDEVQVGPYEVTYRQLRPGQDSKAPLDNQAQTLLTENDAMAGNLNQLNLFEILGTFETQEKSGTISISTDKKDGQIILDKGKFVKASFENTTGEDAVFAMLALEEGLFTYSTAQKAAPMKIMRTFDYNATGPGVDRTRDLSRVKISQLLKRAKELGERGPQKPPRRGRGGPSREMGGGGAHPGRGY